MDFGELKERFQPLYSRLDHNYLNESLGLESPTSEEIARWLFRALRTAGVPASSVTIEETCSSRCTYSEP